MLPSAVSKRVSAILSPTFDYTSLVHSCCHNGVAPLCVSLQESCTSLPWKASAASYITLRALLVVVIEWSRPKIAENVVYSSRIASSGVAADHFGAWPAIVHIQGNAHRRVEGFAGA